MICPTHHAFFGFLGKLSIYFQSLPVECLFGMVCRIKNCPRWVAGRILCDPALFCPAAFLTELAQQKIATQVDLPRSNKRKEKVYIQKSLYISSNILL